MREEIKRLIQEASALKEKAAKDLKDCQERADMQKKKELADQKSRHTSELEELKRKAKSDLADLDSKYKDQIKQLEADLADARKGFDHERQVLEKKRTDMQADYEKQL